MKQKIIFFLFSGVIFFFVGCTKTPHPITPPNDTTKFSLTDFKSAEDCKSCHPQYYDEWSGSMHAYSSKDPIWNLKNNELQNSTNGELGTFCFQCHSPIAYLTGNTKKVFSIDELPPLVQEGVTCDFCHTLRSPHNSTYDVTQYNISPGNKKYGGIQNPVSNSYHENVYDASFSSSELCRECHDLVSNGIEAEITFTEWQRSQYGAMSVECQKCHMETYTGKAAINGPIRDNLHRHTFIGVDVAISNLPNREEQKRLIDSLLKNSATFSLIVPQTANTTDSTEIITKTINDKTGHNLPSAVFPSREMWIEITVWKNNDTIFRSGNLDQNKDLIASNHLTLFSGKFLKNGIESSVFDLDSLINNSLKPFETRESKYKVKFNSTGTWTIKSRLLIRPFAPKIFRSLNAHQYLNEIPTFEMANVEKQITITN